MLEPDYGFARTPSPVLAEFFAPYRCEFDYVALAAQLGYHIGTVRKWFNGDCRPHRLMFDRLVNEVLSPRFTLDPAAVERARAECHVGVYRRPNMKVAQRNRQVADAVTYTVGPSPGVTFTATKAELIPPPPPAPTRESTMERRATEALQRADVVVDVVRAMDRDQAVVFLGKYLASHGH